MVWEGEAPAEPRTSVKLARQEPRPPNIVSGSLIMFRPFQPNLSPAGVLAYNNQALDADHNSRNRL
jgi:hypothetical protein